MKRILFLSLFVSIVITSNAQTNTKSILFNGTSDSISVPHSASLNPTAALTIEAWIKATSFGTNLWDNYIVGKDDWNPTSAGYCLRCGAGGKLSFNLSSGGGAWKEVTSTTLIPTNTWTHVAGTFDGTTLTIYINGVQSGTLSYSGAITPSLYGLDIGAVPYSSQGGRLFKGNIDQVEVWNVALTSVQVNKYMHCPPAGTETGLVGFWNFEEGTGATVTDLTSNHNNGTIYTATWSTDVQPFNCSYGINEVSNNTDLNIYPNPTKNTFNLRCSLNTIGSTYTVCDQIGRQVMNGKINNEITKIDISQLAPGIYMLQVNDVNNIKTYKVFKN